jgi:hypothetical protein
LTRSFVGAIIILTPERSGGRNERCKPPVSMLIEKKIEGR